MELLSQSTLSALQVCGTDEIPEKCFQAVVDNTLTCILNPNQSKNILNDTSTADVDVAILKQSYPALMTLFIEVAKTDMGPEQFSMLLDDCDFPSKRKEVLQEVYKANKQKLRAHLALIGTGPPHAVDIDWRLDYNMKNSHLNKVMDLQYTIALKTEQQSTKENGQKREGDIQFSCSREQLQDFVGKLKEAVKAVERASQS